MQGAGGAGKYVGAEGARKDGVEGVIYFMVGLFGDMDFDGYLRRHSSLALSDMVGFLSP